MADGEEGGGHFVTVDIDEATRQFLTATANALLAYAIGAVEILVARGVQPEEAFGTVQSATAAMFLGLMAHEGELPPKAVLLEYMGRRYDDANGGSEPSIEGMTRQ